MADHSVALAFDDMLAELEDEWCGARAAPPPLAKDRHGAPVVHPASDHVGDDGAENGRAVRIEKHDGGSDHRAEVSPCVDPALEQCLDIRHFDAKAVASFQVSGSPLLVDDRGVMLA